MLTGNHNWSFYVSQCCIRIEMAFVFLMKEEWGVFLSPFMLAAANLHSFIINEHWRFVIFIVIARTIEPGSEWMVYKEVSGSVIPWSKEDIETDELVAFGQIVFGWFKFANLSDLRAAVNNKMGIPLERSSYDMEQHAAIDIIPAASTVATRFFFRSLSLLIRSLNCTLNCCSS